MMPTWLKISPTIDLDRHSPIVALESTVISHGLPYPANLETALRLEEIVRSEGAIPATIGIIAGEIVVGLDRAQIEHLATAKDVRKVSRRDLAVVVARRLDGATTVATTAWAAHQAGIRVFATGGIGGVHRAGSCPVPERSGVREKLEARNLQLEAGTSTHQTGDSPSSVQYPVSSPPRRRRAGRGIQHLGYSFLSSDISADLPELAQTPVLVVCAGAKAILDLPATLEWLETYGIPVVGYGTDCFPAFYNRDSGLPVDVRADSPEEVAALYRAQRGLGLPGGMLVTAPVPPDAELPRDAMDAAIRQALEEAEAGGIRGRALTPFLLSRVSALTGEASLRANLALLENNARLGAQIAVALAGS
jgi:pseudouridine-5'-phosphate glycosidase